MRKYFIFFVLLILLCGCSKKYTITYYDDDKVLQSVTVSSGESLGNDYIPEKDGYLFVNWVNNNNDFDTSSEIYEDKDLYAKWVSVPDITNSYTVTFMIEEETREKKVKEGKKVSKPSDPSMENYKFIGWYLDDKLFDFDTIITKDITLVAKFEAEVVNLTFNLNGGSGVSLKTVKKNEKISLPDDPVKFGYKFMGWYLNGEVIDENMIVSKDITLEAKWEAIKYVKVIFDTDGGEDIEANTMEANKAIGELPVAIKEGYKFVGWYLDDELISKDYIVEDNITLVAHYEK